MTNNNNHKELIERIDENLPWPDEQHFKIIAGILRDCKQALQQADAENEIMREALEAITEYEHCGDDCAATMDELAQKALSQIKQGDE